MSFLNSILFGLSLASLSLLLALSTGYCLFGSNFLRFIENLAKGNRDDDDGPGGGLLQEVPVSL